MNISKIQQPFLSEFPGDFSGNLMQRQTPKMLFAAVPPAGFPEAQLLLFNKKLAEEIGLGSFQENDEHFLAATYLPENIITYATAYGGHQFGNWAGQLGDGRALYAGEIRTFDGRKTELQWKGAGATPYSRHADGRAVLRSSLREYLMSEAMHHLGIPTTRALSLSLSGEDVIRDMMYSGNPKPEKGAIVMRTAESFLRFGHYEWMSAQKEYDTLQQLVDFTVKNYYPKIQSEGTQKYKDFFMEVCRRTRKMVVEWLRVGFVHGVMNTDNMSALGLTIDYGPFSMMDEFDLNFTPNTTDLPGRRYAFGQQAKISQWNLWQFANALFPLIQDEQFLEQTLNLYGTQFWEEHDLMLCRKFGFDGLLKEDEEFFLNWQGLMQEFSLDYTLFFTILEKDLPFDFENLSEISYQNVTDEMLRKAQNFQELYKQRLAKNTVSTEESRLIMNKNNPKFILRNYLLYQCIAELEEGKKELLQKLNTALENPYQEIFPEFSVKRPSGYDGISGCSMLSCSS